MNGLKEDMRLLILLRLIPTYLFTVLLLVLLANVFAYTQDLTFSEKRFYATSVGYALDNIDEDQRNIFTGPQYHQYFIKMGNDGHPFFFDLRPESITYDGITYKDVNFIYDIFLDEVVVINPDSNWISLDKNNIKHFSLGGHNVRKVESREGLAPGFYESLFEDNRISLLAKWSKVFNASVWKEKVAFFVCSDKVYRVDNRRDMMKVLADKDTEVKKFISQNKLKFGKNKSKDFKKVIEFYASLKQ
jgi:hypothetical protein